MVSEALERLRQMRERVGKGFLPPDPRLSCPTISQTVISEKRATLVRWNACQAGVLDLLVKAGLPMSHTALVQSLAQRGYDKATACKGIAACQRYGWIEHNLVSGYVLSGSERQRQLIFDGAA